MAENLPIKATIDGTEYYLHIPSSDVWLLEGSAKLPAYSTLNGLFNGGWQASQVSAIIEFAAQPVTDHDRATAKMVGGALFRIDKPEVVKRLASGMSKKPFARYAVLAQLILSSALVGIDPDEAVFSDAEAA